MGCKISDLSRLLGISSKYVKDVVDIVIEEPPACTNILGKAKLHFLDPMRHEFPRSGSIGAKLAQSSIVPSLISLRRLHVCSSWAAARSISSAKAQRSASLRRMTWGLRVATDSTHQSNAPAISWDLAAPCFSVSSRNLAGPDFAGSSLDPSRPYASVRTCQARPERKSSLPAVYGFHGHAPFLLKRSQQETA